jgi:hypothetical protein
VPLNQIVVTMCAVRLVEGLSHASSILQDASFESAAQAKKND